jgi:hypothetical protein
MYSPIVNNVSNTGGRGSDSELIDKIFTSTCTKPPFINKGASITRGLSSLPIQKSSDILSPEKPISFFGIIFALKDSFGL